MPQAHRELHAALRANGAACPGPSQCVAEQTWPPCSAPSGKGFQGGISWVRVECMAGQMGQLPRRLVADPSDTQSPGFWVGVATDPTAFWGLTSHNPDRQGATETKGIG